MKRLSYMLVLILVVGGLWPGRAPAVDFHLSFQKMVYDASPEENDFFGSVLATGDFNGDGYADIAIGCPSKTVLSEYFAGSVTVFLGARTGLGIRATVTQNLINGSANEARDSFGASLASGDFNGDGYDDLAIGIPEEDYGSNINVGAVAVIPGTLYGLNYGASKTWTADDPILHGSREAYDFFGQSLASGNFNGDAYEDLVIGVPREDIGSIEDAGEVQVIYGSASGLSADVHSSQDFDQNAAGVPDTSEAGDFFGWSLATGRMNNDGYDDLLIGIPYEDVEGTNDSGAVLLIEGSALGLRTNNIDYLDRADGFAGGLYEDGLFGFTVAIGRHRGADYGAAVLSSPGRDTASLQNYGINYFLSGSSTGFSRVRWAARALTQPQSNTPGAAPLLFADINHDGYADFLHGQPRYDIGPYRDGGIIGLNYGWIYTFVDAGQNVISPYADGMPGNNQDYAQFGAALSMGDYNNDGAQDLAIGIPGYTVTGNNFAGAVMIMFGTKADIQGPLLLLLEQ